MIDLERSAFLLPTKNFRRLSILLAIHHGKDFSQHKIAQRTGLSAAMVNSYIKDFTLQGAIGVAHRNKRDRIYTITAKGREQLMSLLVDYSSEIVQLYGQAKSELHTKLREFFSESGAAKIVLFGGAETGDLVYQALREIPQARLVGVVDSDPAKQGTLFHGHPVLNPATIESLRPDQVIITSFARQDEIYATISHLEDRGIRIHKLSAL